ncbi:ecotin family protein (plasmid) [Burkholderia pyrrocinia]|uniref:ecotin family protein n=1 Tax=Burkholderia pyrrocinia TaxID=60550 RepID=UPI0038B5A178
MSRAGQHAPWLYRIIVVGILLSIASCTQPWRADPDLPDALPIVAAGYHRWSFRIAALPHETDRKLRLVARKYEQRSCNDSPYQGEWVPVKVAGSAIHYLQLRIVSPPHLGIIAPCPMNPPAWIELANPLIVPMDSHLRWVIDAPIGWSLDYAVE